MLINSHIENLYLKWFCCRNIIPSNIIHEIDFKLFSKSISILWRIVISLCGHYLYAITSKLMIVHYFVIEFSSIVMRSLQNWWLHIILWYNSLVRAHKIEGQKMGKKCTHYFVLFCDRIQVYCDAVTSKMMINHYFVDRFFRVRTFSWAEFDERSEEGSRNIVRTRKYHTTVCLFKIKF